jgi:diacylglycerol kinase (ATP)
MKILFIINPISGSSTNDKAILHIHEMAAKNGFDFKFHYTTGNDDDNAIQHQLKEYNPDRVIAGGGDGTIQLVARNLIHKKFIMGILPLGSANGLATALGVPQDPVDAVNAIVNPTENLQPLDLLKFNNKHLCIHLGDIGVNALMVKRYEESEDRGMMTYAKYFRASVKESPLLKYEIKTSEGIFKKEGYMLAFANAHKYGTGVHISEGNVSDGKFEICNVETIALDDIIKAGLTIINVFVDKNMFSDVISCSWAEINIDQQTHFQIDGEYMGLTDHLKIEIIPAAVKLLINDK